ncbi:MAG: hypothetical protein ACREQ5_30325, partial [Candidatus Dormibacteria bacterium]
MTAAGILDDLTRHGYHVELRGPDKLAIRPPIADPKLRERVLARKPEIVAYLREMLPPASAHRYVVARADEPNMTLPDDAGVCIACGLPWSLHG